MRLLKCDYCHTLDEVPDFQGPPEKDEVLQSILIYHNQQGTGEHLIGDRLMLFALNDVNGRPITTEQYNSNKEEIIKRFNAGMTRRTGLDAWVYEDRKTYAEEAMKCFNEHHRPTQTCIDWWSDAKRLSRPTTEGKAALKDSPGLGVSDPHLCQWCPVSSYVRTEVNAKKGLYN